MREPDVAFAVLLSLALVVAGCLLPASGEREWKIDRGGMAAAGPAANPGAAMPEWAPDGCGGAAAGECRP